MSTHHAASVSRSIPWRAALVSLLVLPALAFALFNQAPPNAQEAPVVIPAPTTEFAESGTTATAVFAGGCFWGVQGVFQHVKGVTRAVSGYSGGAAETATYEQTGSGTTGHAEAVEVGSPGTELEFAL